MRRSAGILLYRHGSDATADSTAEPEVLIGHMGGPFWARKDEAAWSIPKGEYSSDEEPEVAARREFREELGVDPPDGPLLPLGEVRQSGKIVVVWALEGDLDPGKISPGTFTLEWPPRSGTVREFPELDRVAWMTMSEARPRLVTAQRGFLDRLSAAVG